MKRLKRFLLLSMGLIMIIVSLSACSSKDSHDISTSEPMERQNSMAGGDVDFSQEKGKSPLEPEKVITTINMYFETTDFDASQRDLGDIIKKHDSYVESSNVRYNNYYNSKNYRYASYVIRVPKDKLYYFKEDLKGVGNIVNENTNKTDVSKEYNDTKSRLNILEIKEERLLKLLEKAEKIEDIIALENQLNEVVYEKERLKSSLLDLDDRVDFTTINLEIEEVERFSNVETIETGFGVRIKNALLESLYVFKASLEAFVIWLIYFLPFGVIFIALGFVGFKLFKRFWKNK